jgi:subtilisin-like proprotein convertase family protein/subtilisin family serine protease
MPEPEQTYTYRGGQRLALEKEPDRFVVRALPEDLEDMGFDDAERVSASSSRVNVRSGDLEQLMAVCRHLAPTHHAYTVADTGEEFLITDRIIVTFREPPAPEQLDEFAGRYALLPREKYSDREFLYQLTDHTAMNPVKLVVKLSEEEPLVEGVDHDLNYRAQKYQLQLPTDPLYRNQWHLHRSFSHQQFDPRSSSRCEEAWQILGGFGSPEVVVGVTDDGCRLDHPDFDSLGKFAGWTYLQGNRLVRSTDVDAVHARMYQVGANHGTSCAGVIASEVDGVLTVGAAPACRLLPVKWESQGPSLLISDSKLRSVLDYVADKVDILSNSWGSTPTSLWASIVTNRIRELAQTGGRRGRGIVFLWAAGNENCPIQHNGTVDIPYHHGWHQRPDGSWIWVGVRRSRRFQNNLVGIPGVMHVAALASTARRSHYSNYGEGIDLCAPSSNSHAYFRQTVPGLGITTATGAGSTTEFGGTSSATPLVAGVAALVIAANPELSAIEVISLLKRTASKELDFQGYPRTTPTAYDSDTSWDISPVAPHDRGDFLAQGGEEGTWSPWFGHGRVDAPAAVAEALRLSGDGGAPEQYTSAPQLAIPDNNAAGIRDTIQVDDAGQVEEVVVEIEITHTWIGDLRVRLIAPDGTAALLHDRAGGSQRDLHRTYDLALTPALAAFRERRARGQWMLHVQDLAARDTGTLERWSLQLGLVPENLVFEDPAATPIPDNDPAGITRSLNLPPGHVIDEIAVSVDITHTWIGDLRVALLAPDGTRLFLHDRAGGSADNIVRTWHSRDFDALRVLRGRETGGTWRLQVADVVRQDIGKLNRWALEVVP